MRRRRVVPRSPAGRAVPPGARSGSPWSPIRRCLDAAERRDAAGAAGAAARAVQDAAAATGASRRPERACRAPRPGAEPRRPGVPRGGPCRRGCCPAAGDGPAGATAGAAAAGGRRARRLAGPAWVRGARDGGGAASGSVSSQSGLGLHRGTVGRPALSLGVVRWGLGEEVGRHQAPQPVQLAEEEAVFVHVAVHVDHVTRAERKLGKRIGVWTQFRRVVVIEGHHPLGLRGQHATGGPSVTVGPPVRRWSRPGWRSGFGHVAVHVNLGHHVAGHEAHAPVGLALVETVLVFASVNLYKVPFLERQFFVCRVWIRRHGLRVVVEQGHEPTHPWLPLPGATLRRPRV